MNRHIVCALLLALVASFAQAGGNKTRGQELSAPCAACHGADGNSVAPDFPRLAGQHESYLFRALQDYKSGARKNAIMAGQVENLKKADMADLAAYFSSLAGPLHTKH
ncbi:MAG: cytochrome c [Rhodocyclaceae bacterium]|nr:cytochrome c [Rhodocyclaceae bacterium]MBX3666830.1 cytochrome c [Rhodocyclaceae bacterium]